MSIYCSESSAGAGEEVAGTAAADTEIWVLLEYAHNWAAMPLESPDLGGKAKDTLQEWLKVEKSRFQLVRQQRTKREGPFALFIGKSSPVSPWLIRFELSSYEELAKFSLADIIAENGHPAASVVTEPMHLVCTHGKRDRCCAKWGMGLYSSMSELAPERIWQTSHLGGHRFAATSLSLPYGICYGRLVADDAKGLVAADDAQSFFNLDKARGRTAYPQAAQAAEVFLRRRDGERGYGALKLEGCYESGDDNWVVVFRKPGGEVTLQVERESLGQTRIESCKAPDQSVGVLNFREVA